MTTCIKMFFGKIISVMQITQFADNTSIILFKGYKDKELKIASINHIDKIAMLSHDVYTYTSEDAKTWCRREDNRRDKEIDKIFNPKTDFLFVVIDNKSELNVWVTDMDKWYEAVSVISPRNEWPYNVYYTLKEVSTPAVAHAMPNVYNEIVDRLKIDYKSIFNGAK